MDLLNIKPHAVTEGTLGKNFLFYGPPSSRKTTVAANFPKPLLLATEVGYSFIPGVKAQNIKSWYEFREAIEQLKRADVREAYDTIVIDTLSLLTEQCVKFIVNKHGVQTLGDVAWGRGWNDYKNELNSAFSLITQLGYGLVFISHSKEIYKENEEGERKLVGAEPALDNQTKAIVNAMVDFIFYLNQENDEDGNPTVMAYSGPVQGFMTKSRVRDMKPKVEFTYENINSAIVDAISNIDIETVKEIDKTEEKKMSLDELKASITENAKRAESLNLLQQVGEVLQAALNGITLPEATMAHYDALEAVNLAIKDLIRDA